MKWIKPPALCAGDTIGIVAPASNIKLELLEQGCRELEILGFRTTFRPDIVSTFRYFAGPDARRRDEFIEMLGNPEIKAIFCARGGYGSGHLVPDLNSDLIRSNPKIISGASDITALLGVVQKAHVDRDLQDTVEACCSICCSTGNTSAFRWRVRRYFGTAVPKGV
jgi:muramoyltetrapeptide carboxypeptidase